MTSHTLEISAEVTPNPNTLKFNVNRVLIAEGSLNFTDKEKAKGSALPEKLFEVPSVLGVMVGRNFITVTKNPEAGWNALVEPVTKVIRSILESDHILFPQGAPAAAAAGDISEIEQKIRAILDNEIRPAVAMDGGDITFYGYDNGVVTLHLQGSCSSCPSSVMTLKMGVENRLKALIPEVREVVQI
ncbi:MAG: NifU family protein [Candidatus Omnitrophica bacterium]|nr:NifU family protein [Candidatus Omnitrophota bacterium]